MENTAVETRDRAHRSTDGGDGSIMRIEPQNLSRLCDCSTYLSSIALLLAAYDQFCRRKTASLSRNVHWRFWFFFSISKMLTGRR